MKKLLTFLVLTLALCMVFVAFAEDTNDEHSTDGTSYFDPTQIHTIDGHEVKNPRLIKEGTCGDPGIRAQIPEIGAFISIF